MQPEIRCSRPRTDYYVDAYDRLEREAFCASFLSKESQTANTLRCPRASGGRSSLVKMLLTWPSMVFGLRFISFASAVGCGTTPQPNYHQQYLAKNPHGYRSCEHGREIPRLTLSYPPDAVRG